MGVILLQPSRGGPVFPGHGTEGGPRPALSQPPFILSPGYRKQQTEAAEALTSMLHWRMENSSLFYYCILVGS